MSRKIFEISKKFFSTAFYTIETEKIKIGFLEQKKIRFSPVQKSALGTLHKADRIADGETLQGERKRGKNASSEREQRTRSEPDGVSFKTGGRLLTTGRHQRRSGSDERSG